jgi:hypothetical protein
VIEREKVRGDVGGREGEIRRQEERVGGNIIMHKHSVLGAYP